MCFNCSIKRYDKFLMHFFLYKKNNTNKNHLNKTNHLDIKLFYLMYAFESETNNENFYKKKTI